MKFILAYKEAVRISKAHKTWNISAFYEMKSMNIIRGQLQADKRQANLLWFQIQRTHRLRVKSEWSALVDDFRTANAGDRALDVQSTFELENRAYSLYVSQNSTEKAKLLKMLLSNY